MLGHRSLASLHTRHFRCRSEAVGLAARVGGGPMTWDWYVQGTPVPQPRPRAYAMKMGDRYTARMYDAGTTDHWKKLIWVECHNHRPQPPLLYAGHFAVKLVFHMPRPKHHLRTNGDLKPTAPCWHIGRPDLDNLAKAVLDAITDSGFFWKD